MNKKDEKAVQSVINLAMEGRQDATYEALSRAKSRRGISRCGCGFEDCMLDVEVDDKLVMLAVATRTRLIHRKCKHRSCFTPASILEALAFWKPMLRVR